jgi:hypothetical protein
MIAPLIQGTIANVWLPLSKSLVSQLGSPLAEYQRK